MRKTSLLLILTLFIGSCSTTPDYVSRGMAAASGGMCLSLVNDILGDRPKTISEGLSRLEAPASLKKKYAKLIDESDLTKEEMNILFESLPSLSKDKVELFEDYLTYAKTLFPKGRKKALADIEVLMEGDFLNYKPYKTFNERRSKFASFYSKEEERILKKLKKERPNVSERRLAKEAKKQAGERGDKFKRLYNGCHTKGLTKEHKAGGKAYTLFTIGLASLSSGVFYTASNYEEEDFLTSEFFGKLGYEMAADAIWATMASFIFKDPEGSFLGKSIKMYLADNSLIVADALTWEALFGEGEEEAKKKIEMIRNSPEFQKEIVALAEHLKRDKFMDKVKEKFGKVVNAFRSENENETALEIDWENIKPEDLDDEEVQEQLIEAALISMYEEEKGEMSLGSYSGDRYAYYSAVGIPFMFLDTFVATKIYQTMCMAPMNPKRAVLTAGLIFSAYSVFYDVINYPLRKHTINQ